MTSDEVLHECELVGQENSSSADLLLRSFIAVRTMKANGTRNTTIETTDGDQADDVDASGAPRSPLLTAPTSFGSASADSGKMIAVTTRNRTTLPAVDSP